MRDKILETLCAHDQDKYGVDMSGKRKINVERAADELAALMCYREVRAIMISKATYPTVTFECQMFAYLKEYYPEQAIREAIEKFKNEQK